MEDQQNYKANRLFYDLRQLHSYCELGMNQPFPKDQERNKAFYTGLFKRTAELLDEGHLFIAIAGDEEKSPLHCINTHQYEVVEDIFSSELETNGHIPHQSTIEAIAGEYSPAQIINDTNNYISRKTVLCADLDENMVTDMIQRDIELKRQFLTHAQSLAQQNDGAIHVVFHGNQNKDTAVQNHVFQKAPQQSMF